MPRCLKTPEALIFLVSTWIALVCNTGFWHVIASNKPPGTLPTVLYLSSFLLVEIGLISFVMMLLVVGRPGRTVLGLALVVAAGANFFTARYGVLFDPGMLTNIVETNRAEAYELISPTLIAVLAVSGLIPAIAIWRYPLSPRRLPTALMHRSFATLIALGLIGGPLYASQKEIFSVARNHQELRHMIAPINILSASYVSVRNNLESPPTFQSIALDASHANAATENRKPAVHVLIVGETARAANFSLNGYALNTNPELAQRSGIQLLAVGSCGTATAVSLPCMFSNQERKGFDRDVADNEDNLLDIAMRSGYDVHWIDNGNGCKGICSRVATVDVHSSHSETICPDSECYDEILVENLQAVLSSVSKDTLIVLHQLGSHGPAYFRRYPETFRPFHPDCRSANFGDCSQQEISNAYDNTIAYTDHVIAAAIDALSAHTDDFSGSLIYISDHGESLGEHNLYLHGMPYQLAPSEQTTVPMIVWLGQNPLGHGRTMSTCTANANATSISHDNLFHTELGILGISTDAYKPAMDIFSDCRTGIHLADSRIATQGMTVSPLD